MNEIIQQEEIQLGTWPRRLLHVSTLTSCEWAEGNIYKGVKEPRYVAISYTWGRWALRPGEKPGVESIRIKGVDTFFAETTNLRFSVIFLFIIKPYFTYTLSNLRCVLFSSFNFSNFKF